MRRARHTLGPRQHATTAYSEHNETHNSIHAQNKNVQQHQCTLSPPPPDPKESDGRRDLTPRAHVAISRRELTSRAHVASSRCELIAVGLLLHVAAWGVGWGVGVAPERIRIDLRRPRRLEPCAARPHACHHLVRVGVGWELDGCWMGVGARAGWRFTRGLWLGLGAGLGRLGMRLE